MKDEPCRQHSTTVQVISKEPNIYKCPRCGWFIGWKDGTKIHADDLGVLKLAIGDKSNGR